MAELTPQLRVEKKPSKKIGREKILFGSEMENGSGPSTLGGGVGSQWHREKSRKKKTFTTWSPQMGRINPHNIFP